LCTDKGEPVAEAQQKELDAHIEKLGGGYKARLAPINSVGVQGDNRSYKKLVVLSADGVPNYEKLFDVARSIPNALPYINRVAFRADGGEADELVCTSLHIVPEAADILREADDITTKHLKGKNISQCFAVLLPIATEKNKYSIAMRAVVTNDFMTARAALPGVDFPLSAIESAAEEIKAKYPDIIDMVLYDVTGKPPATVEWE
jgi:GMP synthase (glutamine-hydrolysing)